MSAKYTYENDLLTAIVTPSATYTYDPRTIYWKNLTAAMVIVYNMSTTSMVV